MTTATEAKRKASTTRIDPRLRDRYVAVKREQGQRRLRRLIAAAAALGVVLVVVAALSSPIADVDEVVVRGNTQTSASEVRAAAQLFGCAVAWCDTDSAARRVEKLPWVATARVSVSWPNEARVVITERVPLARVAAGDTAGALVDRSGRILLVGTLAPDAPRLELRGVTKVGAAGTEIAPSALSDVAAALPAPLLARAIAVQADPLAVVLDDGSEIRLGDRELLEEKLGAADAVRQQLGDKKVAYIDVRVPSAPAVGAAR